MLNKDLFKAAVEGNKALLAKNKDRTQEELMAVVDGLEFCKMSNGNEIGRMVRQYNLSVRDAMVVLDFIITNWAFLNDVKACTGVTYGTVCKHFEQARMNFIIIHRVIYMLHDSMLNVYDILENEKRMKQAVKKFYKQAETTYNKQYDDLLRDSIERTAWSTMQDSMRIACDAVHDDLEKVFEAIRNKMISDGMRDVELKGRIVLSLWMYKVFLHSYNHFFEDFEREVNVNYKKCFSYADITPAFKYFVQMCEALGMKISKDKYGTFEMEGFSPDSSQRFKWAWEDFMLHLRDEDIMDESAKKAIEQNPKVNEEYQRVLDEAERERQREEDLKIRDSIVRLSEKFNVTRK